MIKSKFDKLDKKYKAVIFIILSAFCFAFMNAFVRMSGNLPTTQKVFFRNLVALFFAAQILIKQKIPLRVKGKRNNFALFTRCFAGTLGMIGNFYAVDHLVLADASMLNKMSPFFVVVFSFIILKEKLTFFQAATVAGAFCGSLFIIKPSLDNVEIVPAMCGFLGGLFAGLAYTCVRYLGQHEVKGPLIVAYFSAFSCLLSLPLFILNYHHMSLMQVLALIGAGTAAAGGQFSITAAYSNAPAKEISVYDYSQIIFSTLLGLIMFGDIPDLLSFVGYIIIITMAVLVFLYNNVWNKSDKLEKGK